VEKSSLRRADLLFSVFLIIGSFLYFIETIKLFINPFGRTWETVPAEAFKETFTFWYQSPALLPFLVSILLFLCGLVLLRVARKDGARLDFISKAKIAVFLRNREFRTFIVTAVLICVYAFVLIPQCRTYLNIIRGFRGFPFFVATFLYLFAMMMAFGNKRKRHLFTSLLVSVLASGFVTYAFGTLAKIPLP
jgi:hypothetical protein